MIAWFARNHVAANLLMVSILFVGLFSLSSRIPLEVFPSVVSDSVSVKVSLRGATPEDVEQGVAVRIEEAVQDLEGIEQISSRSSEGSASVTIEVDSGYDARELLADIKSRVDAINTFPVEAEKPIVALAERKRDVIAVNVASIYSEKEIREFAEQVRDDLLQIPGITQLELAGVRNYEISIEISQDKLRQYGLSINQVSAAIASSSSDVSAGNIKADGGDILIRSKGQAYHKDQFSNIVIKTNSDGSLITLNDIAQINDGFEETPIRVRFNGKNAAFIDVFRIGQQSAIDVAEKVRNYIEERQETLPYGYELSYWDDDSQIVKGRISTLTTNAIQGLILVFALLSLFLRPSIALWVCIGIPVSFMGAFIFMPVMDITLNIMSLFAFILVLGIVVDDAIVTGENIYTHLRNAESGEHAAIVGTQEVATPVTFGILTTVAAFIPLAFMEGGRGPLFAQIPYVVIPVLLFSLIESKFVLPSHLKNIKLRHEMSEPGKFERFQQKFADGFERVILRYYQPLLGVALKHKLTTLSLFIGILVVIGSLIFSGWTKFVFFPRIPSETVRAYITMPVGTPFEVTNGFLMNMADKAEAIQDKYRDSETGESLVINILASTGGQGGVSHSGSVRFEMLPPEQRTIEITSSQIVSEWRQMIGVIPGAESVTYRAEIGRSGDPIDVQLSGQSFEHLRAVADLVNNALPIADGDKPPIFDGNSCCPGFGLIDCVNTTVMQYPVSALQSILAMAATKIEFFIDDVSFHTFTNDATTPFNADFFLILNVAMGGTLGGTIDPAFTEDTMEIDYVKVYQ